MSPALSHALPRSVRVMALALVILTMLAVTRANADGDPDYGPTYGDNFGSVPELCADDMVKTLADGSPNPAYWDRGSASEAICHHMRTDLNPLDSPEIDVLILLPASPTVERDTRIITQSIEMWEQGIQFLSRQMALDWLAEGVNFHITVDVVGTDAGEFTTYPVVDPEIVVIASNPVGGIGIGIDPIGFFPLPPFNGEGPCHGLQNPFDIQAWRNVPGFDSHHESRSGTYVEDCDGAGGNVCFAVNGAIDPAPGDLLVDFFELYDLVSHEVGHCLSVGHVGDGGEGDWGGLPPNDIMAYDTAPVEKLKCVSTLDVEAFAARMSGYLDVNDDGTVDEADRLLANDQIGEGGNPFQVQRPDEHFYASATGAPEDCPQPDMGLLPGERVSFTPEDWPVNEANGRAIPATYAPAG